MADVGAHVRARFCVCMRIVWNVTSCVWTHGVCTLYSSMCADISRVDEEQGPCPARADVRRMCSAVTIVAGTQVR